MLTVGQQQLWRNILFYDHGLDRQSLAFLGVDALVLGDLGKRKKAGQNDQGRSEQQPLGKKIAFIQQLPNSHICPLGGAQELAGRGSAIAVFSPTPFGRLALDGEDDAISQDDDRHEAERQQRLLGHREQESASHQQPD
jgi:hypothetical protein